MAAYIFYPPTVLRRHGKYNEQDANFFFMKHAAILSQLKQMLRTATEFSVRTLILEEMEIAERKMKFWKSRQNFDPSLI